MLNQDIADEARVVHDDKRSTHTGVLTDIQGSL